MNGERLEGKIAVITGAAGGIGLAAAKRFLQEGARVMLGDYNSDAGRSALDSLEAEGFAGKVAFSRVDVSDESSVEALMHRTVEEFAGLDIAFNNAGIVGAIGPIVETRVEHWDETFAVMLRGVFLGIKHAARIMIGRKGGSIINTASIAALSSGAPPTAYSAAKAAVVSLTQNAANELAEYRIRVNAICPGIIFTQLMHQGRKERAEVVMHEIQPWPDRGEPHHIANAALYLASDESMFVTGSAHVVDGGYLANGLLRVHPLPGSKMKPDYAGISYGTTGQSRDVRRLPPEQEV